LIPAGEAQRGYSIQFRCSEGCNDCCILRGYGGLEGTMTDPGTGATVTLSGADFGKEGAMEIETWELPKISKLIRKLKNRVDERGRPIQYRLLPARGVSAKGARAPEVVISYFLMGRDPDGNMCPFLSTANENKRLPDSTLKCSIYEDRPLQCRAYPVRAIYSSRSNSKRLAELDQGCEWVIERLIKGDNSLSQPFPIDRVRGLDYGSRMRLQRADRFDTSKTTLWAYATGTFGRGERPAVVHEGWVDVGWG
jgi:Fe-S-cluster containining protein